jgi:phosphatidylinositol alpha-1,6-mannosyltransferase
VPTTLIVTNDFPPRVGGIESFVADSVAMLDHDVVVLTSSTPGSAEVDRELGIEVVRCGPVLLPTPTTTRVAVQLLRRTGASRVLFGAAAPLGLMAGPLRRAGATRIVALSHGHETWWAALPVARSLLRNLADDLDHLTTISDYTARRIAPALSAGARSRLLRLSPPVDVSVFRPDRARRPRRPRVVSVGRFVRQKGFSTLLHAWRLVLDGWTEPDLPELVLVGDGPERARLTALLVRLDLRSTVRITGRLPRSGVVGELQLADVFALPMRTRLAGLNPEGLGLAAIEAAACALPVVVGDSGGAPETVQDGRTGYVVDPSTPGQTAERLMSLLRRPDHARDLGAAGRVFVTEKFGSERARLTLRRALDLDATA